MIFLETDRLLFRSHEPQDEVDFVQMHTDPEVRRYVGGSAWPREKAMHRFRNAYLNQPSEIYGLWATIFKENEKYIGCCGIANPPNGPGPSLGYYIARQYWGRGLASEASQAFINIAFRDLRLPRIFADVEKGHGVSEHILQKFAFKIVSEEKYPTGRVISLYELLRTDWEKQRA
ncbi:MAG TPA: GNAT family N-acetyltransferase [Candidatus Acidoferrales bacterium]|nr:GNAT family N-acetyltransferase [Candidatus Acidoferrales bacterium]